MRYEKIFDLPRAYVLSATNDYLLLLTHESEIALLIEPSEMARFKPATFVYCPPSRESCVHITIIA